MLEEISPCDNRDMIITPLNLDRICHQRGCCNFSLSFSLSLSLFPSLFLPFDNLTVDINLIVTVSRE